MGKMKSTVQIDQHGRNVHHVPINNRAATNKQQRVSAIWIVGKKTNDYMNRMKISFTVKCTKLTGHFEVIRYGKRDGRQKFHYYIRGLNYRSKQ